MHHHYSVAKPSSGIRLLELVSQVSKRNAPMHHTRSVTSTAIGTAVTLCPRRDPACSAEHGLCSPQVCERIQTRCLAEVCKSAGLTSKTRARHSCRRNIHKSNSLGRATNTQKENLGRYRISKHLPSSSTSERCQVQEEMPPVSPPLL